MGVILNNQELLVQVEKWHLQHLRIVFTNGCFDLLHVGHLRNLRKAKLLGDLLVIGLNSDRSIRNLKGENRPLVTQNDRAEMLAALEPVDIVTIFEEPTAIKLLEIIQPQIYVKGGDYVLDSLPEKETLLRLKVEVKFIPLVSGVSTSRIIGKINSLINEVSG